jgi:hypothetical protein
MERIALTYETISWSWGSAGDIQFEANWAQDEK